MTLSSFFKIIFILKRDCIAFVEHYGRHSTTNEFREGDMQSKERKEHMKIVRLRVESKLSLSIN